MLDHDTGEHRPGTLADIIRTARVTERAQCGGGGAARLSDRCAGRKRRRALGLGFLSGGRTGSLEMLVVCDELAGMTNSFAGAIAVSNEYLAFEAVKR